MTKREKALDMIYKNYRGEVSKRNIVPLRMFWGVTRWHPEPGWILTAFDTDKAMDRSFALKDCDFRAFNLSEEPEL